MEEAAINPTIEQPELTQDWETGSLRALTKPCVYQDPGERNSDPQETVPYLPVGVCESLAKVWVGGGLLQAWGHRL